MDATTVGAPRIGVHCDAGPSLGVGHLVRCHALAEELLGRGAHVEFLGDPGGVAWARELSAGQLTWSPAPASTVEWPAEVARRSLDAVVLDSYTLDPRCAGLLRAAGTTVLAIVDTDTRGQQADLYLDQNLGAEHLDPPLPPGAVRLAGARYVLLRESVRAARPPAPRGDTGRAAPELLCVFGGTDAAGVAPAALRLAAATGAPFAATVIAASETTARELTSIPLRPGQSVTPIPPTPDLPALAAKADVVLSAAGSSTWEMLCLGVPTALVWVAGNQRRGYDETLGRGLAVGLGGAEGLHALDGEAIGALRALLTDAAARAALAARGHALIDGRGRERVADALLARVADTADDRR